MHSSQSVRGVAITTAIAAIFGLFWGFTGVAGLPSSFEVIGICVLVVITLAFSAIVVRFRRIARQLPPAGGEKERNPFRTRAYKVSVLLMILAIPVTSVILRNNELAETTVSVIAIIVGLHFFGLIRAFGSQRFAVIGGAMCLIGVISLGLPVQLSFSGGTSIALRQAVVGMGCAVILWASALGIVIPTWLTVDP